jgi:hypothetical protein
METFLKAFDQELGLAGFTRVQPLVIVGSANLAVGSGTHDALDGLDDGVGSDPGEA